MIKLLILYPHWYPSNLAGVHRSRLVGNYLPELECKTIILAVKSDFYEEQHDPDMVKLFSKQFTEYRVRAFKLKKPRIIGDLGLRAFWQLYRKGQEVISDEKPDFLWIPIPSFYTSLLGRLLHRKTGIPYGIDYIDPWVRDISKDGSLRARLSLIVAKFLEPIAVKRASLITGVAFEYYKPVLDRNFSNGNKYLVVSTETKDGMVDNTRDIINHPASPLEKRKKKQIIYHSAFPYGFDPLDHEIEIPGLKMPWDGLPGVIPIVYAGAFMPNSQYFLDVLFQAFAVLVKEDKVPSGVHLYFLGTGMYPHKRITDYAADHGISDYVTEIRERFPFLHILNYLAKADRLLIIGSTEKHYTASKTFQVILSKRPFLGMFHYESTAVNILHETHTNRFLVQFKPLEEPSKLFQKTKERLEAFLNDQTNWQPDILALGPYSAKRSAEKLVHAIQCVLEGNERNV